MERDPYQELGVKRSASEDAIKKAWRKQVKRWHPDTNPDDPQAETRTQAINNAYDTLTDPAKRRKYDRRFPGSGGNGAQSTKRNSSTPRKTNVQHKSRAKQRTAQTPLKGQDIEKTLRVTLKEAWSGTKRRVVHDDGRHTIFIHGIPEGNRIRYPGKGGSGEYGGPPGDLYVVIQVTPHNKFTQDDDNLNINITIDHVTAQQGGKIDVPTMSGNVSMTVETDTRNGRKYRLKNRGMPRYGRDNEFGDLFVHITVKKPVATRGNKLERQLRISLREAWAGSNLQKTVGTRNVEFTVPRGARNGQRIHIAGEGKSGLFGGPPGDLYFVINVLPDEQFRRDGDDLYIREDILIDLRAAINGGKVNVPTFYDNVQLNIPPRTQSGDILSMKGHGMPLEYRPDKFGDLYAQVRIQAPDRDEWEPGRSTYVPDAPIDSWYWPPKRSRPHDALYMKIQFKDDCYDWAVLVNNSELEFRGRESHYSGKCHADDNSKQSLLNAAASARQEVTAAFLKRIQEIQALDSENGNPF